MKSLLEVQNSNNSEFGCPVWLSSLLDTPKKNQSVKNVKIDDTRSWLSNDDMEMISNSL